MDVTFPDSENDGIESFPDDAIGGNDEVRTARKWRELPEHIWYLVVKTFKVKTQYGPGVIVTLQNRAGEIVMYWTTPIIGDGISSRIVLAINGKRLFIKSLGKRSNVKGTSSYYDFETLLH